MNSAQAQSRQRCSRCGAERWISARSFRGFTIVFQRDHRAVERPGFCSMPIGFRQVGRCLERLRSCLVKPRPRRSKVYGRIAGSRQAPVDHSHQPTIAGQHVVGLQIAMQPDRRAFMRRSQRLAQDRAGLCGVDFVREGRNAGQRLICDVDQGHAAPMVCSTGQRCFLRICGPQSRKTLCQSTPRVARILQCIHMSRTSFDPSHQGPRVRKVQARGKQFLGLWQGEGQMVEARQDEGLFFQKPDRRQSSWKAHREAISDPVHCIVGAVGRHGSYRLVRKIRGVPNQQPSCECFVGSDTIILHDREPATGVQQNCRRIAK